MSDHDSPAAPSIDPELFAWALRSIGEGVCVTGNDDRIRFVNPAFAEIYGTSAEELIERPVAVLRPPDFPPEQDEAIRTATEAGGFRGEIVNVRKDGSRILVELTTSVVRDDRGRATANIGVVRDITAERRRQEELEENENRYRLLFEAESDAIFLIAAADGRIIDANRAATELYGYSRDELLAMRNVDLSAEPEKTRAATEGDPTRIPVRWHRKQSGEIFPVEITARHLEWRGRRCHIAAIRDIEEWYEAQRALKESEQKLRDIVNHSTNLFYSHTPDQVLTYVSPQSRDFFDCEPEEALRRWTDFATDNPVNQRGFTLTRRAIETGRRQPSYELELEGVKGRRILVEVNEAPVVRDGRTVAVVGALTDITERRRTEQALAESERNYREIFNATTEAIFINDAADGRMLDVNDTMLRMYGYDSKDEVLGLDIGELSAGVPPYTQAAAEAHIRRAIEEGPQVFEWLARRRDGEHFLAEVSLRSSTIGGRGRVLAVVRDITERRALEEQLRHSQKIEALGRLAGGVAHDFNNLLQAVLSTAQILRLQKGDGTSADAADQIAALVDRGAALVRQLLLFARREGSSRDRLDLKATIDEALAMLRRLLPENIGLDSNLPPDELPVDADAGQLEQVLVNLVVNARDAMPQGGRVRISAGDAPDTVWFEVEDTGHGMDSAVRERIFEPFFTTKDPGQGTGLGLAVVHGIVNGHGGSVRVESNPGVGCRVRVDLPKADAAASTADRHRKPGADARGEGERILLVEDETAIRGAMQCLLQHLGYRVEAAASAEEALELAGTRDWDLLLSDVILPGMSGPALAERLLRQHPGLPVILMSGHADHSLVDDAVSGCGARFLQKPVDMATLAEALHDRLGRGDQSPA